MAGPSTDVILDEALLRTLECPICTEIYDSPKQLSCGHTYCNQCIESLANQSRQNPPFFGLGGNSRFGGGVHFPVAIVCPECRASTKIPQNGLPTNYRLLEFADRYRRLLADYIRCVCGQWCKMDNIFYCETCQSDEAGPEKVLLCGTCALTNHNMHSHSVQKFKGVDKEAKRKAAEQISFAAEQLKRRIDDVTRKGHEVKGYFGNLYDAMSRHYLAFAAVSDEIMKRHTLNQAELNSKMVVSEKKLAIFNEIFQEIDKAEQDINNHLTKLMNMAVHRLTTLDREPERVEIPTEEERSCDVSSTGREAEINLNTLVINEGHEQQPETPPSKASVFTYKPDSSKTKHRRIKPAISKRTATCGLMSTSTVTSTLPCIQRSVSSATFMASEPTTSDSSIAHQVPVPCDTDDGGSDASL